MITYAIATICAPWSDDHPPAVTIATSPAVTSSSKMTPALVAFDAALSRFGWTITVSATWSGRLGVTPRACGGAGRRGAARAARTAAGASADGGTRTPKGLSPPRPKRGASASSATSAGPSDSRADACSRLVADELVEQGDTAPVGYRDVAVIRQRPPDAEQLAVLGEDRADVGGEVREEVARIRVRPSPADGKVDREAVDGAAAVRVDEPADQLARMRVRDLSLPVDELDAPLVLLPRPVLGEGDEPDPTPGLESYDGRIWSEIYPDVAPGSRRPDCPRGSVHDLRIRRVEVDPQLRTTTTRRDASVSEVEAEKIGVGPRVLGSPLRIRSILDDAERGTVQTPSCDG